MTHMIAATACQGLELSIDPTTLAVDVDRDSLIAAITAEIVHDTGDVRALIRLALSLGYDVEVESDAPEYEDYGDDTYRGQRVGTTQMHRLLVDGEEVATLEREGWSYYGDIDHPNTPGGEWTTDSGENDQRPSDAWSEACSEAGIGDGDWGHYPGADEPDEIAIETDEGGPYCLYWVTSGDDEGPLTGTRYPTLDDALNALRRAEHNLHCRHRGTLLCGYAVAELIEGEWRQVEGDQ